MKRWVPLAISLLIAFVFVSLHLIIEIGIFREGPLSKDGILRALDRKALDYKFKNQKGVDLPDPRVIIAGIDERSIEKYGMWPWDRSILADFIDVVSTGQPKGNTALPAGGAKVIAFDAVFSDDNLSRGFIGADVLKQLYNGGSLKADSTSMTEFQTLLKNLVVEHQHAQKAVQALELQLKEEKNSALVDSLAQAKRAASAAEDLILQAQKHLQTLLTDSDEFYQVLASKMKLKSPEEALAKAISKSPQTILGYILFFRKKDIVGVPKSKIDEKLQIVKPSTISDVFEVTDQEIGNTSVSLIQPLPNVSIQDLQVAELIAALPPLQAIAQKASHFGHFNAAPDVDGPLRRLGLLYRKDKLLYPALSLVAAANYFESAPNPVYGRFLPNTLAGVEFGGDDIAPTTSHGELLLNYYKMPEEYFPTYSVADFIDGTVSPEVYKDKVVLFGMTALGLYDLRPTPFSPTTPGVYIHAMAVQNMLDGRYLERFYGIALYESLVYLLLALVLGLLLPQIPAWSGILATLAVSGSFYFFDSLVVFPSGTWMLIVFPVLEAFSIFLAISVYGYLTEGREKRKIRQAFQFYLTKSVVDEVLLEPKKLKLGGEKRVCTVLFSDIRGFTTISERLEADQLVSLLNEYLTPMTNLVFKYDGTLDKYMGDAIMAIFGAPVAHEDHAVRACKTALEMMTELKTLQVGWRERGLPELDVGIGLNTGPMSVGNMGSEIRFDYTVMGDNVNLGSRLEGINKQYGTNIIISEYTFDVVKEAVFARELDSVRVKGKREPVRIYELLGVGEPTPTQAQLIDQFSEGIRLYKAQQWDVAKGIFEQVRDEIVPNDFTSRTYIKRCETMAANPPGDDWDGVFTMTTK